MKKAFRKEDKKDFCELLFEMPQKTKTTKTKTAATTNIRQSRRCYLPFSLVFFQFSLSEVGSFELDLEEGKDSA